MKNLLIKSLFEVQDTNWHFQDRSGETDLYQKYVNMHRVSVASYSRHLTGTWELKFIGGKVNNINQAFKKTFFEIYNIWRQGSVNILYTDPDTVAMKKFEPWGLGNHFMMFNFTDPRMFDSANTYNKTFEHFFNAGVRYFPAGMSQHTWDLGLAMAMDWDESTYDTEQVILNTMLWSQGVQLHQVLKPELAYQAHWLPDQATLPEQDRWNGIDINHAAIVHTHSSRNINSKLQLMKHLTKETT